MPLSWISGIEEGKKSFNYMINNFNNMFDGDIIKHFYMRYVSNDTMCYVDDINEQYGNDIHKNVVPWIQKEFEDSSLTQINNWKPFRDSYTISDMFLGYIKLFKYKQYYFQLTIDASLWDDNKDCIYCKNNEDVTHFSLALYGWKDENSIKLQPSNIVDIPLDSLISKKDWNKSPYLI